MGLLIRGFKLTVLSAFLAALVSALLGGSILVLVLYGFSQELPSLSSAEYRPRQTTVIYDRNGGVLAELHTEVNRAEVVPITEVPVLTRRAFVAIEDDQFYEHYGVRPDALVRAVLLNLIRGRKAQGGSTITMQLARNRFLHLRKTITRKLKEMIMAFRLERNYTKDEILGQYLNEVFFGGNNHGIAAAARFYFGKQVRELNLAESAVLAGILPAPNAYSPTRHFKRAKRRQYMVLEKMWQLGYITRSQAREAYLQRLVLGGKDSSTQVRAPYYVDHVTRWLVERFGIKKVYGGGLKVHTTLDPEIQATAEEVFAAGDVFKRFPLEKHPDLQGGFLALDPLQGAVRAMIGGRDFEVYKFNRTTQARRQPGSSFKTFVYAEALRQGIQPNAIFNDEPIRYLRPETQEVWEPQNSTGRFHGPVILSQALEQSYNIVAVKLLERVGIDKTIKLAKRLGVKSPLNPDLALALGASEVTLMEMVSAYGTIANQGIQVEPHSIVRIEDDEGNMVFEHRITEREALDPRVAYQLTSLLRGVVERGTGHRTRVPGYAFAGKTGTTQHKADAWFLGFTPDLVVGCSVGFDTRKTLGRRGTGGSAAGPIIGAFNKAYLTRFPPRDFLKPEGVVKVAVCKDSGFLPLKGCKRKQDLVFLKGKGPSTYCPLHQVMEYRLGSGKRAPRLKRSRSPSRVPRRSSGGAPRSPSPAPSARNSGVFRPSTTSTPPAASPRSPAGAPDFGGELDLSF
jgi:penicillin-binding protein 1A